MTTEAQEKAVANYLTYMRDKDQLVDSAAIKAAEKKLQETDDVLEELRLTAEIARLREVPEEQYLKPFLQCAHEYARQNGLSAAVFEQMGVDRDNLRKAGFKFKGNKAKRRRRHTVEEVESKIMNSGWTSFTRLEAVELSGASNITVRTALDNLIKSGAIAKTTKDDPRHTGRGTPAKLYEFVTSQVAA